MEGLEESLHSTTREMVSPGAQCTLLASVSLCTRLGLTVGVAVAMPMNCSGMYRGVVFEDGVPKTAIFDDDELD